MAANLYEVLGVHPGASRSEVRAAYLDRAREAHPDRWVDGSADERRAAERRMQDVTAAWRVLGDARRRRGYDAELHGAARERALRIDEQRFGNRSDGTPFDERPDEPADAAAKLVRLIPWVAVLAVLGLIFVFTAYAVSGGGTASVRCVDDNGATIACSATGARTVVLEVDVAARCPAGTTPLVTRVDVKKLCLR